jgi:HAD superfamily hydrolase (TIGR01509 family)
MNPPLVVPLAHPPHATQAPDTALAAAHARVDWRAVDIVMLDMDGTILDLAYDNHFWHEYVPVHYARQHGMSLEQARTVLAPLFVELEGQLRWYCLDHWSEITRLDLVALKHEIRERIQPLDGSLRFLDAVREAGKPLWLVTNAHPGSWRLKLDHTELRGYFDAIVCSHDFGAPKEHSDFWTRFETQHRFVASRALFVDDSLPVLRAARRYGLGQVVAVRAPDTTRPARHIDEFPAIDRLADLLPID